MNYFITGCNGLVGSYIARKLLDQGEEVSALRREKSSLDQVKDIENDIQWYEGDILDVLSIEKPIEKADFVIHCAGMVSFLPKDFHLMYKVNVEGTANIVNTCLKIGGKKLLYISSVAALGVDAKQDIVDESQKWDNSGMNTKYGLTKFMGEEEVWRGNAEGLDVIVVNPSVVLGRGEWGRSSLALLEFASKSPIFYPEGNINFIDARDLADIIYQLIEGGHFNEKYIVSAGNISFKDMLFKLTAAMGKKPPKFKINAILASLALVGDKFVAMFTSNSQKLSKELIRNGKRKTLFSNKKINDRLGFTFRKLEDTIEWAIALILLVFFSENIYYI